MGRAFQHPLSRPSSFRGVKKSFRFDVMQIFNNVQMNGRSCSPKHGPWHFTVLKNFFVWEKWSFLKTFEFMAALCSPRHNPVLFTVLKILFVWMFFSHVKTFMRKAGPRIPTSFVTAQLISRRWRIVLFCSCADFNNVQMNGWSCFPKNGGTHFTVLKNFFPVDGIKFLKNIRTSGWTVLP